MWLRPKGGAGPWPPGRSGAPPELGWRGDSRSRISCGADPASADSGVMEPNPVTVALDPLLVAEDKGHAHRADHAISRPSVLNLLFLA